MSTLLNQILATDALSTVFQPIYREMDGIFAPELVECLSRGPAETNAAHAGVLFEYAQLKAAESSVDRACITGALQTIARIKHSAEISVNVFAATIARDNDFIPWLFRLVNRLQLDPAKLVFEIVEHGETWNTEAFTRSLREIRSLGCAIALDDVGLAHSNFQRILQCDPEFLKLDRCIVQDCHKDRRRQTLLRCLALLTRELGSQIIAEGIETEDDLATVRAHGIKLVQGFLFSRPVPADKLEQVLSEPARVVAQPIAPRRAMTSETILNYSHDGLRRLRSTARTPA
jgi:EAL domain-containing protein (putative c-di-GMP-specific phosphodiesterase class I)